MAKAKGKTAGKGGAKRDMLLIASKVKEALRGTGKETYNVASDALEGLNEEVHRLIERAKRSTTHNGRKTVRHHDF